MNEILTGIYSALTGGTALITALGGTAIYHMQAPESTPLPYVVFSLAGGGDENITPSRMINVVCNVRVYADDAKEAWDIMSKVDTVLENKTLTVSGQTNFWTMRENCWELTDNTGAETIYAAGAYYRIRLDS